MKKLIYSIVTGFVLLSAMFIGWLSFAQEENSTTLLPWSNFNSKLVELAWSKWNIKKIIKTDNEAPVWKETKKLNSEWLDVDAWFDEWVIYYHTEADKIYMNEQSNDMFYGFKNLEMIDLTQLDTSKVVNMHRMFHSDEKLTELNFSRFNTENVDKFEGMFYGCKGLVELDLSNFKIKSGVNVKSMFNECNSLHKIYVSNLFKLENVTNSGSMFNRTLAIEWQSWTKYDPSKTNGEYARIDEGLARPWYFTEKPEPIEESILISWPEFNAILKDIEEEGYNAALRYNGVRAIRRADSVSGAWIEVTLTWVVDNKKVYIRYDNSSYDGIIYYYSESPTIYLNEDSSQMFKNLSSLEELELSGIDTSKVTNMASMFEGCESLEELDLSRFDTSKVESMEKMFYNCKSLKNLDLSNFNTENVTNMRSMFNSCFALETLNMSNFDTTKVENMQTMFHDLKNIKELDLTSFNTENVTNMDSMFNFSCRNCSELETVYVSDKFSTDGIWDGALMFQYNDKLIWWNGTRFSDINNQSKDYAKIDKPDQPWYFTDASNITVRFIDENGDELYATWVSRWTTITGLTSHETEERETGHSLEYYSGEEMTEEFDFDQPITKYTEIYTKWTINNYHISFVDRDGRELSWRNYKYGTPKSDIVLPDAPEREWYGFSGWAWIPETMPAENVTWTAEYNIKQYTITFVDWSWENADVVYTWEYNSPVNTDYPTWTKDGYTISWDKDIPVTIPAENVTITAKWEEEKQSWWNSWWYSWWWGHSHDNSDHGSAWDEQKENNTQEQETTPTDNQKNEAETQGKDNTQNATHEWSYQNWLTKYINASDARLGDSLTRSEMAKLSSIFATNVLWETPDESKQEFCSQFADISKLNGEMREYVIKACELWYMWYQSNGVDALVKFRPYSPVTVAEASVIVSRMKWWNQNASSGKNWYKWHLYAAYNHRLLDDIRNPYKNITRWETFEMFYRASK